MVDFIPDAPCQNKPLILGRGRLSNRKNMRALFLNNLANSKSNLTPKSKAKTTSTSDFKS